jgi:5-methylthioadenosine/S-adenosylhomocysteine deaminase
MSTISTNFIVSPSWILPVVPTNLLLENHSLVVLNNKIKCILPTSAAIEQHAELPNLELPNQVLMPGLINTHGHSAMALLRGYADDYELKNTSGQLKTNWLISILFMTEPHLPSQK